MTLQYYKIHNEGTKSLGTNVSGHSRVGSSMYGHKHKRVVSISLLSITVTKL